MQYNWFDDLSPLYDMQAHWEDGTYKDEACFHLTYEHDGPFSIVSGASLLAGHIRNWRWDLPTIRRLGQETDEMGRSLFNEGILNHLQRMNLRVRVMMPNEGTLLLPGEPLLVISGPIDQIKLLGSALTKLILKSTHWATQAALQRWRDGDFMEKNTPVAPLYEHNPKGWRIRAAYMGGQSEGLISSQSPTFEEGSPKSQTLTGSQGLSGESGLKLIWQRGKNNIGDTNSLEQIRRLFKGNVPLGDVWLHTEEEPKVSVSKRSISLKNEKTGAAEKLKFGRYLNLFQLVLYKGHSVYTTPKLEYRRQRALHNLEYFAKADLDRYPMGWHNGTQS